MTDVRRFDALERIVRETRVELKDMQSTMMSRLSCHTHEPPDPDPDPDPAPTVNAGLNATFEVGGTFSRVAAVTGIGVTSRAWTIQSGPTGSGTTISTSVSLSWIPTVAGTYVLRFSATNPTGTGTDDVTVIVTAAEEPPPEEETPANVGEALWVGEEGGKNHFNIGIGQPGGGTNHTDTDVDVIEGGFDDAPWFTLTPDGDAKFRMNVEYGRTSSGTKYARSELRELTESGAKAAWNSSSGTHYMKATSRVMRVAPSGTKPEVCFFQCHDAESDLIRIITTGGGGGAEGLRLKALWSPPGGGSEQSAIILNSYSLGQWVDWEMRFVSGTCTVYLNGVAVLTKSLGTNGCYFKTGCYNQVSNLSNGGSADSGDYCEVQIKKGTLETWHSGYDSPTEPVFTGGGGGFAPMMMFSAPSSPPNPLDQFELEVIASSTVEHLKSALLGYIAGLRS